MMIWASNQIFNQKELGEKLNNILIKIGMLFFEWYNNIALNGLVNYLGSTVGATLVGKY